MKKLTLSCALALSVLTFAGCYEVESRVVQRIDETWEVGDLTALDLESINGRIEIQGTDQETVRIRAEVRASRDSEDDVVRFSTDDGVLKVREKWSRHRVGVFPFSRGSAGSVRYEIEVPARFVLDLDTTNGRIETSGVRGDHSVTSVNGRIEIETPDARVTARTVNGRIEARFWEAFHGAKLKTVNGSVKVYVPADTRVSADVDQVNGSFNSRLPVVVNAGHTSEGVPLKVTTVNGSVTLDEISRPVASGNGQEDF